jgi:transcriptional regulator with XRE-family HTH domain
MPGPRELKPDDSIAAFFGSELRRLRESAGWSQDKLGREINYSGAYIGMVELASRTPPRDLAERADRVLKTDGLLTRLWPHVNRGNFPSWFRGYVELEALAVRIQSFEAQCVPGLLQTEDYARALFGAGRSDDAENAVAARMERQSILSGPTAPMLWTIVDEAVLRRPVGGSTVMRDQLKRLAEAAAERRIVLQVLPFEAGAHACMNGSLSILSFTEGADIAYLESSDIGELIDRPEQVQQRQLRYDLAKAAALSPEASVLHITALMEER